MGVVVLAEHIALKVKRAVKIIEKSEFTHTLFKNETEALKNVKHKGIPLIYDVEEDEQYFYIVEEYIEGSTLSEYLTSISADSEQILKLAIDIGEILSYLHNFYTGTIIHLDIKPDNIVICNKLPYLLDFGSSVDEKESLEYSMGSKGFCAPEQVTGCRFDRRTDIYSFGKLVLYMFWKTDIELKDSVMKIISMCIEEDIDDRVSSIDIVLRELRKTTRIQLPDCCVHRIRVTGTQSRVGVTTFCMALLYCMKGKGIDVKYIERNSSMDAVCAVKYYGDDCDIVPDYKNTIEYDIPRCSFRIEDWGSVCLEKESDEDIHVIIAGGRPWELEKTFKYLDDSDLSESVVLFNYIDNYSLKKLQKEYGVDVHRLPYISDVTFSSEAYEFFEMIFGPYCLGKGVERHNKSKILKRFKKK